MTTSSHLASSALTYLVAVALAESPPTVQGLAVTAFGSLIPDLDAPTSSIGRPFFPLSSWINRKIGHRTLTHSLLGLAAFAALVVGGAWGLRWLGIPEVTAVQYAWLLVLGYGSHILVDTLNKTGVELFCPARLRCVFFNNERYRISAAGKGDYWFMTCCLLLNLATYPLAKEGFTLSLHQAFGDIYSVGLDFKQYGEKDRIWVDLEGVERISNRKVRGRFEVLGVLDNGSMLIDRDGVKQIVSRTEPFQVFPTRSGVVIGERLEVTTQDIGLAGRTLGEIPRFPGAARVLIHGYVTPVKMPPVSVRHDRHNAVSLRLDKLKLDHAEYGDLQGLEHVVVREGVVTLKICRTTAGPVIPLLPPVVQPEPIRQVTLRLGPTDEVLLAVGQAVHLGQVIVRKDVSIQAERLRNDCARDLEALQRRLADVRAHRQAAREDLRRAATERTCLQAGMARLADLPLLTKEAARGRNALQAQENRVGEIVQRINLLVHEERQVEDQIRARQAQLSVDLRLLAKQAEVPAGFSGRITRLDQEANGDSVIYSVFYRAK